MGSQRDMTRPGAEYENISGQKILYLWRDEDHEGHVVRNQNIFILEYLLMERPTTALNSTFQNGKAITVNQATLGTHTNQHKQKTDNH